MVYGEDTVLISEDFEGKPMPYIPVFAFDKGSEKKYGYQSCYLLNWFRPVMDRWRFFKMTINHKQKVKFTKKVNAAN